MFQNKIVKLAVIRTHDDPSCPFGLSVPFACSNVGQLVTKMAPLALLSEEATDEETQALTRANRMLFMSEANGERCPYAGKVFKDKNAVECNQDSNAPGVSSEQGLTASPFYSKVYNNVAYDGLYSYPLGWYGDNNISRNLYYGIYSLQGSENKREIEKVGTSKAVFTGWSCISGPAELVDYMTDPIRAEEVSYEVFSKNVDVDTAPLDETQFEVLPTDWAITWLQTRLPSGREAWVMQHSGIEFLFTDTGNFDYDEESRLAQQGVEHESDGNNKEFIENV